MLVKKKCRLFARLLALVMILSLPGFTSVASAVEELDPLGNWTTQYVDDPNLITNVTNPSNGVIRFKLTVPAGRTATYKVELIPHDRTGSINTVSGTYTNSGTSTASKTISVNVNYYSDQYTIYASYQTGTTHEKIINEDTEAAISALKTAYYEEFIWTEEKVAAYAAGESVLINFAIGSSGWLIAQIVVTLMGGPVAMGAGITLVWGYAAGAGAAGLDALSGSQFQSDMEPEVGMRYRVSFQPSSRGIQRYLTIITDDTTKNYDLGILPTGQIVPI